MRMPEFSFSMMLQRDARIHHSDLWKKRFLKLTIDHILKHGIVGETAGGTQDIHKLFRAGEFKKEYGECELGPKCPKHQKPVKDSLRKYDDISAV